MDRIRDFLALHYRLNTALDTRFWRACREDADVFYANNGPTGFCRYRLPRMENDFGVEGYLVMLVGNRALYRAKHTLRSRERAALFVFQGKCPIAFRG